MRETKGDGFESLGLRTELVRALVELGFEEPTPVQRAALPALLAGRDVLAQAATGTGKTAAFALPILERLELGSARPNETSALVIVPTRELAIQVAEATHSYGKSLGVAVLPIYGGQDIGQQLRRLRRGVDIVIATPGRALDHLRRKSLLLGRVQTVVLDEADEMLDLGFADDLETLLAALPAKRQTALFSATLPPRIAAIAEKSLRDPVRVRIEAVKTTPGSLPKIRQIAYVVPRGMRELALGRLLDAQSPHSAIIFCRTRIEVERLTERLSGHGYGAAALHGGLSQSQRDQVLRKFKAHKLELLVATDVAARGLDVKNLSHVINFELPNAPEAYVHRIGRTGRAGKEGLALTLLESRETRLLRNIERLIGQKIEMGRLPTVGDLRTRRLELTRATIEEVLAAGKLEDYRHPVEQIAATHELVDVAAAAVAALHANLHPSRADEETEIPSLELGPGKAASLRGVRPRATDAAKASGARASRAPAARGPSKARGSTTRFDTRIFIGLGRSAGLRPADLVGAIANEAHLNASEIGAIEIADRHAYVEVAKAKAAQVVTALRRSTLRGRKVTVDTERPGSDTARAERRPPGPRSKR